MKFAAYILFLFFLFTGFAMPAQKINVLDSLKGVSLRGLCPVDNKVVWASGSKGYVVRSTNGGKFFSWKQVPGFEKSDFRDIEAFDSLNAVIMSSGTPAVILRTENGGKDWKEAYRSNDSAIFLDGMEWMNRGEGFVLGDPVNGQFLLLHTKDSGKTWANYEHVRYDLKAAKDEAAFAASGTCIRKAGFDGLVIATGGKQSRILITKYVRHHFFLQSKEVPIIQGKPSTGIFSVAFRGPKIGVVVGGDYLDDTLTDRNCYYTTDGGNIWIRPKVPPSGYRSCVENINKRMWIATGPGGTDFSNSKCKKWKRLSKKGFHVVRKAKQGPDIYFSGSDGRIGKLDPDSKLSD
ncbi:MAG: oxidoreductase [Bacteroidetes bacterium]|nr:MAG: oxidoreductase [Bacteroidota bacterium]